MWYNISNNILVQEKTCWNENAVGEHASETCEGRTRQRKNKPEVILCHCYVDLCNTNLTWVGYKGRNICQLCFTNYRK